LAVVVGSFIAVVCLPGPFASSKNGRFDHPWVCVCDPWLARENSCV
jgi:hypothetical protein